MRAHISSSHSKVHSNLKMSNRYSVGCFSLFSCTSDGQSVDSSFNSAASASTSGSMGYEIESDVGREALKEICCSALSRLLDFPDNQLEILLGYDEKNSSEDSKEGNIAKNVTSSLRSMKRGLNALYHHKHTYHVAQASCNDTSRAAATCPSLTLGSPLSESSYVVFLQLISHLNRFVSSEGLFRKSGNKTRMEQLVEGLQEGKLEEVVLNKTYNAHDFASVLKQYLSELPDPLLLKRHLNAYIQAVALSSPASTLHCLQLLMLLLQPSHRVVLQHLLDLLFQVTRSPHNKMDSRNLSLILAPTLFLASRSESLPSESFEKLFTLLSYMIENAEEIFEVPAEVQVVADRYYRKIMKRREKMSASGSNLEDTVDGGVGKSDDEQDGELIIDAYSTSCKRRCVKNYHESGKENGMTEVAKLHEMVKKMPEGPQKARLMKKFEITSKKGCTPTSVVKLNKQSSMSRLRKSLRRNKENATPKINRGKIQLVMPCFTQGSLISEFEKAEDCAGDKIEASESTTTTSTKPTASPTTSTKCTGVLHNSKDMFKTPAPLKAFHTSTTSCHVTSAAPLPSPAIMLFKNPKSPSREGRFIRTDSPVITDI